MIRNFFHFVIRRTHFWRYIGFAELAELYTSRMLRVMAMQIMGGFTAIYLYQTGYSLSFIAGYFLIYFIFRALMGPLIALVVARYGPKHGTFLSNISQIIGAIFLVLIPQYGAWALLGFGIFAGLGRSLYDVCYLVDFSKIKQVDHAGKELGIMQIIERMMVGLGPVLGGVVAFFFGTQAMFIFGAILMFIAALPLFFTSEPTKVHQKITLRHFNWRVAWRPSLGSIGSGIDMNLSGFVWGLFLAISVFSVATNAVYIQIGALSSISMFAAIACAYFFGRLVDRHEGKKLLKISAVVNALIHLVRPLVSVPTHAVAVNVANEFTTTGCNLPSTRGIFDTADGLPGYRIVYMTIMSTMLSVGDAIAMGVLLILTTFLDPGSALHLIFLILGPATLLIMFHATALYRRGILTRFIHRV